MSDLIDIKQLKKERNQQIKEIKKSASKQIKDVEEVFKEVKAKAKGKVYNKEERALLRQQRREAKKEEYLNRKKRYSTGEEIFNSVTHGIGTGLAIAATVLLIVNGCIKATGSLAYLRPFYISGVSIFGAALIFWYLMSTLYHALTPIGAKKVFAIFDHVSMYILIAATYTPYCLITLHRPLGWVFFGIVWALAITGVALYAVYGSKMRKASAFTYFIMAWPILFTVKINSGIPSLSEVFVIIGLGAYTIGGIFYSLKGIKWMHSIWHLFAIAGSIMHYFAAYFAI